MRDRLDEFGDITIAVITFARAEDLSLHRARLELPFPLLADPERALYRRFGLGRGPVHRIWGPGTLWLYTRLLRRGRRLRRPTQDTRQLGGDFVIGPDGRLSAGFWPASPDARAPVSELVAAIRASR